jgi:maleylacetate reductase
MKPFTYEALPVRVVFGAGTLACLPAEVEALELERVLVIAGGSAEPVGKHVSRLLGDRVACEFAEVRQHVPQRLADAAREAAAEAGIDGLVSIGGGSAIGLAKAVAIHAGVPIVAVPTTYSGSEMTPIYGITGERKQTGRDLRTLPKVVVYDPELTTGLPARVTASSGFNALAHCVEALYAPGASPPAALLAEEGIRVLGSWLPIAVQEPAGIEGRSFALYGAYLAGSALAAAGTSLHHKLCHVLGGTFDLVHADVHAVLLPHVVAFNQPAVPEEMHRVAVALGAAESAPALHALALRIGAPTSLAEIGMPADGLDRAAEQAAAEIQGVSPRPVEPGELRALLEDAQKGRQPTKASAGQSTQRPLGRNGAL